MLILTKKMSRFSVDYRESGPPDQLRKTPDSSLFIYFDDTL